MSVTVNFLSSFCSCLFPKHNMSITHNLIHISNGVVINFHWLCFAVLFFAYIFSRKYNMNNSVSSLSSEIILLS